jgi:hypothetical protein
VTVCFLTSGFFLCLILSAKLLTLDHYALGQKESLVEAAQFQYEPDESYDKCFRCGSWYHNSFHHNHRCSDSV